MTFKLWNTMSHVQFSYCILKHVICDSFPCALWTALHILYISQTFHLLVIFKLFFLAPDAVKLINNALDLNTSFFDNSYCCVAPSTVRDVRITQKASRSFQISWHSPITFASLVTHYQISIDRSDGANRSIIIDGGNTHQQGSVFTTNVHQLTPFTPYLIRIRAGAHFRGHMLWGVFSADRQVVSDKEGKQNLGKKQSETSNRNFLIEERSNQKLQMPEIFCE